MKKIYFTVMKLLAYILFKEEIYKSRHFQNMNGISSKWIWNYLLYQKILRINSNIPWPVSRNNIVLNSRNIEFHPDDLQIFNTFGTYYQNSQAKIIVGKGSYIAPNVGLITANHDVTNLENHSQGKDITIGEGCWIGMNAVILPGVELGNNTVVAAGAVVTKSFENQNIIIGGVPAKIIKYLSQ